MSCYTTPEGSGTTLQRIGTGRRTCGIVQFLAEIIRLAPIDEAGGVHGQGLLWRCAVGGLCLGVCEFGEERPVDSTCHGTLRSFSHLFMDYVGERDEAGPLF